MAIGTEHRVDAYHINIGVGDCAILVHAIVTWDDSAGFRQVTARERQKVVLVDGGYSELIEGETGFNSGNAWNLQSCIKAIRRQYSVPGNGVPDDLRFDAVVISHWDADHYSGVLANLFDSEMINVIPKHNKNWARTYRPLLLKYDNAGNPETVLYMPVWPPWGSKPFQRLAHTTVNGREHLHYLFKYNEDTEEAAVLNTMLVRMKEDEILGTEVFSGNALAGQYSAIADLTLLLNNRPLPAGEPGLFIIAARQQILGMAAKAPLAQGSENFTNKTSIVLVVVWPSGRASHYLAGDLDGVAEVKVSKWLNRPITTIKGSHHGAESSTPMEMLDTYMPRSIVLSSGNKYGHPRWEHIILLWYFFKLDYLNMPANAKPLYCTTYPYFFAKIQQGVGLVYKREKISLSELDPGSAWVDRLSFVIDFLKNTPQHVALADIYRGDFADWFDQFLQMHGRPTWDDVYQWIMDKAEICWGDISPIQADATDAQISGVWNDAAGAFNQIGYLRVECCDSADDGGIFIRYVNSYKEYTHNGRQENCVGYNAPANAQHPFMLMAVRSASRNAPLSAASMPIAGGPEQSQWEATLDLTAATKITAGNGSLVVSQFARPLEPNKRVRGRGLVVSSANVTFPPAFNTDEMQGSPPQEKGQGPTQITPSNASSNNIKLLALSGNAIYLTASRLKKQADSVKTFGSNDKQVDDFISALHCGSLALEQTPVKDTTIAVYGEDEVMLWMQKVLDAKTMRVTYDNKGNIGGAELTTAAGLKFTTDAIATSFKLAPSVPSGSGFHGLTSFGVVTQQNALLLGLDSRSFKLGPDDKSPVMLGTVLETLKVPYPTKSPLMQIVGQMKVSLDTDSQNNQYGPRNAIWFSPEESYLTTLRLQFVAGSDFSKDINDMLGSVLENFKVTGLTFVVKKMATWSYRKTKTVAIIRGKLTTILDFSITIPSSNKTFTFQAIFDVEAAQIVVTILINELGFLDHAIEWVAESLGISKDDFKNFKQWLDKGQSSGTHASLPDVRRISLIFSRNAAGSASSITSASLDLQLTLKVGQSQDSAKPAVVLLTFNWRKAGGSSLKGHLWCMPPALLSDSTRILRPTWEVHNELRVLPETDQQPYLDLRTLLPGNSTIQNIPEGIPTKISAVTVELSATKFSVQGTMVGEEPPPGDFPKLYIGEISLGAAYTWDSSAEPGRSQSFFGLNIRAGLVPRQDALHHEIARLNGQMLYNNGSWAFLAVAEDVYVSNLIDLFDENSKLSIASVMGNIHIPVFRLQYMYRKVGEHSVGSSFKANGRVVLGDFELALDFQYDMPGMKGWSFSASLADSEDISKSSTVGAIARSIADSGDLIELPSFLADLQIPKPQRGEGLVGLLCSKFEESGLCFLAYANIPPLLACFIQYKRFKRKQDTAEPNTKRIIKASVATLPKVEVPLVGDLTQPFDEMFFLWVQDVVPKNAQTTADDDKGGKTAEPRGVTLEELNAINAQVEEANKKSSTPVAQPILYKPTKKKHEPTDVVLKAGWHFMITAKNTKGEHQVILDYVFGSSRVDKNANKDNSEEPTGATNNKNGNKKAVPAPEGDAQLAPMNKKSGPITINNIGFAYKDDKLSIILDAEFLLGPVTLDLLGFGLTINFAKRTDGEKKGLLPTLMDIGLDDISVSLGGMGVAFEKQPITIAGLYVHVNKPPVEYFAGGIVIGFQPWMFMAAGFYGKTGPTLPALPPSASEDDKNKRKAEIQRLTFESVFIFLKLDGPLIEFGFANVSGITGGFGYNVDLRWPRISEVTDFPFVASGKTAGAPLDTLKKLTTPGNGGWVNPSLGSMWVAAGLKVDAFEVLSIDAVIAIQWSPSVKIGIFGVAICDVPSQKAEFKFAHVELGILATVDPGAGVMKIEAQLSPNSYILHPSCHVTGGFAMYRWWKPTNAQLQGQESQHSDDDWVFTVGGYHPLFRVPAHYPKPDRLKISWSLDDTLSITGEAYFAITPKMCMAGGHLNASLNIGALSAWFDAFVNFLINYEPFYFQGDGGVSVGVRFVMDLWLVTVTINVEIGATLHIEGPPVFGTVHVNFWVFGFDVKFGSPKSAPDRLTLSDFYEAVLKTATKTGGSIARAHTFNCLSGLIPAEGQDSPNSRTVWRVRQGQFSFGVESSFALSSAAFEFEKDHQKLDDNPNVYGKPLQAPNALLSTMKVTIYHNTTTTAAGSGSDEAWSFERVMKSGAKGLWQQYDANQDPSKNSTDINSLLDGGDVSNPLLMGIKLTPPPPHRSDDKLLKFNPSKGVVTRVEPEGSTKEKPIKYEFPEPASSGEAWMARARMNDLQKQYDTIKEAWERPESDPDENVNLWAEAMRWSAVNPTAEPLTGKLPVNLLRKFDDLYIRAPCLVVT
ncbi:hypothetical protein CERZMDRAFT_93332 [Cercospora zeae-maydis SCOH1-5]|uniref:DUF6603 domain-containing protein n=1 Tax=Cercospora zeae-maydis SCOH1-5 TaxID=717836 RepID=A0A6A6FV69_9PEZI|nr:hypothetical protein CERZMDRAFT_93332 [Cercospora zeae-maydis SCOH1-5]